MLIGSSIEVFSRTKHLVHVSQLFVAHANLIESVLVRSNDATIVDESFRIECDIDAQMFGISREIVPFVHIDLISPVGYDLEEKNFFFFNF